MIVDGDVRLIPGTYDAEAILRDMDRAGVDRAVVSLAPPVRLDELEADQRRLSNLDARLIGIGYVDPRLPDRDRLAERYIRAMNLPAILLDSRQTGVKLDDFERLDPVMAAARAADAPVFIRVSAGTFDETHPTRLERLLSRWPDVRVVAVHMGGANRPDYCADVIDVARRRENLYLLGSANYWQRIIDAWRAVGAKRLIFGSAAPERGFIGASAAAYRALLDMAGADDDDARGIMGENVMELLKRA